MLPSKKFTIRLFGYGAVLLYLAVDLLWLGGPLRGWIESRRPGSAESREEARASGMVAKVFGHPILVSQVEREARSRLWRRGRTMEELTPEQRRIERLAALNELIDHQLLRVKVLHRQDELPVSEEEIDAELAELKRRYGSDEALAADLAAEGIDSEKELRSRLAARLQQWKYVESRISEGVAVTEEEARAWFDEHAAELGQPERRRVRQVFRATLERDPEEVRRTMEAVSLALESGERSFGELAAEFSEDERTKAAGGELGWISAERLAADFTGPVFAMQAGGRRLIQTAIGWHLVEVLEAQPAVPRTYEESRSEVMAALETMKREEMVRRFRDALRAQDRVAIHVYPEAIPSE